MSHRHLRIYHGPAESPCSTIAPTANEDAITLPLSDVLPLLTDAIEDRRTWLRDFDDDQITISSDLYEVLLTYQHYRRPVA